MSPILLAALPLLVSGITSLIKRTPVVSDDASQTRRNITIRGIAALLSLGGVVGSFMVSGTVPDPAALGDIIIVLSLTVTTWLGSTGFHGLFKK